MLDEREGGHVAGHAVERLDHRRSDERKGGRQMERREQQPGESVEHASSLAALAADEHGRRVSDGVRARIS